MGSHQRESRGFHTISGVIAIKARGGRELGRRSQVHQLRVDRLALLDELLLREDLVQRHPLRTHGTTHARTHTQPSPAIAPPHSAQRRRCHVRRRESSASTHLLIEHHIDRRRLMKPELPDCIAHITPTTHTHTASAISHQPPASVPVLCGLCLSATLSVCVCLSVSL